MCGDEGTQGSPRLVKRGFTLAEALITLGVIGVVAAVTMPTLVTNIQERVRKEQVRTVKYKLTKATDKMNSLGRIGSYGNDNLATERFVEELQKHMTIAKICKNNELDKCWPSSEINAYSGSGTTLTAYNPKNLQTGQSLKALALSTKNTQTVGIVTGDGVPMLLVYSPKCSGFDEAKTYTWSVEDGKPVTNATTNCISAIFDINGAKGPNKIGTDVRTLNSLFGSTDIGKSDPVGINICNKMKKKYGFRYCDGQYSTVANNDRWVGAIYECDKLGLHLPNMQTLANIANAFYGVTIIEPFTAYLQAPNCIELIESWEWYQHGLTSSDKIICNAKTSVDADSSVYNETNVFGYYWSNNELSSTHAYVRAIQESSSLWDRDVRKSQSASTLCVGD